MEGKRLEFNEILTTTMGYDKAKADKAVNESIDAFVYYAGWADKYQQLVGAVNPVSGPHHCFTSSEPVGIVGLVANPNFELSSFVSQIAAILVSGNTLVAVMDEKGAATLAPLAEVFATSDLSKGVVNLLSGRADELYKHLAGHMEVQSICCQNPKILAEVKSWAAENMKRVVQPGRENLALENVLNFIEYKTVWHPIGN
jgi:acyl-CoA reductase-like NAD-dependent aldehyde dehydrogenase